VLSIPGQPKQRYSSLCVMPQKFHPNCLSIIYVYVLYCIFFIHMLKLSHVHYGISVSRGQQFKGIVSRDFVACFFVSFDRSEVCIHAERVRLLLKLQNLLLSWRFACWPA
jgi:hypothetical protein